MTRPLEHHQPAALQQLRQMNIDVTGPVPADTVFVRAMRGEFDAVIAPSATRIPALVSPTKSRYPGVSTKLIL